MILLKSKQFMLVGLTAVALTLSACGGDSAKNGTANPAQSVLPDSDNDTIPDVGDNCPNNFNPTQSDIDEDGIGDKCDEDKDNDGVPNSTDNCPIVANASQVDTDGDGIGDKCEGDKDGDLIPDDTDNCPNDPRVDGCVDGDDDGFPDWMDNCPTKANTNQIDTDNDGFGDACDNDRDGDGIKNGVDNCPLVPNPSQQDSNSDGVGDACDGDIDGDGVNNGVDNCPTKPNRNQADFNSDGTGDVCSDTDGDGPSDADDNCPTVPNTNQKDRDVDGVGDACDTDVDGDGILDIADNCPLVANASQLDTDSNGEGDACDDDKDGDGVLNGADNCPDIANLNQRNTYGGPLGDACDNQDGDDFFDREDKCPNTSSATNVDSDGDGIGDACDDDNDDDGVNDNVDNCPFDRNSNQADIDGDKIGDACDNDQDGDGVRDDTQGSLADNCPTVPNPNQADLDGDGKGDACDSDADGDGVQDDTDTCIYRQQNDDGTVDTDCPDTDDIKTKYSCSAFAPAGSKVEPIKEGALCALNSLLLGGQAIEICGVTSPSSAIDGNLETFTKVNNAVALADSLFTSGALTGNVGLEVTLPAEMPAGRLASFVIQVPRSLVELSLAKAITVKTDGGDTFGGVLSTGGFALELLSFGFDGNTDALSPESLINPSGRYVIGGFATKPFKKLSVTVGGGLSVDLGTSMKVYDVCTQLALNPIDPSSPSGNGSATPPSTNPLAGTPLEGLGDVGSMIPGLGDGAFPPELPGAGSGEDPFAIFTDPEGPFAPLVALFSDPVGAFTTFAGMFTEFFSNPGAAFRV